jgi:hypothetical protein
MRHEVQKKKRTKTQWVTTDHATRDLPVTSELETLPHGTPEPETPQQDTVEQETRDLLEKKRWCLPGW